MQGRLPRVVAGVDHDRCFCEQFVNALDVAAAGSLQQFFHPVVADSIRRASSRICKMS